ncbi:TMEM175 family protein [Massilia sp. 2TAF26]|uniref:TMEM175 family protein n=1 Tax=Massilia sp. 2TAF26 TaxID=3233012 RepID=UPI003F9E0189
MDHATPGATLQLSKHRIEALVDGIFAVAMTLLVIDLRLPEHLRVTSDAQLREALVELLPNLYSWLVSFIVLGIFWVANHRVYSHVRHVDGGLVWRTILMLGGASLLPFASAVNGHFFSQLAQGVYSGVMILIACGSLLVARHIHRNPQLCAHPMDEATYVAICTRLAALGVIALLAVALAGLFPGSANCAFVLGFTLRPLGNAVARRVAPQAEQAAPADAAS